MYWFQVIGTVNPVTLVSVFSLVNVVLILNAFPLEAFYHV